MNLYQTIVLLFALLAAGVSGWSAYVVYRSPYMKRKVLWISGCFLGIFGFRVNWTTPDDLISIVGLMLPVVRVYEFLDSGQVFVDASFPVVAVIALFRAHHLREVSGG